MSALLAAADGGSHSLGDGDNVTGGDAGSAGRGRAGGSRATGDDS